jgi:hypothetical protein
MSECNFYIHAVVDDVAVGFYVEASSHTEASRGHYTKRQKSYANTSCVEQTVPLVQIADYSDGHKVKAELGPKE